MYNPNNYLSQEAKIISSASKLFFGDSAVFVFPLLLADFKDPIQNRDRAPVPRGGLHIAHTSSILLL